MDVLWAIKSRRSCRNYLDKPVEFDKITAILEAGHYAPSAGNLQDWKFILITDRGLIKQLSEHCMEQFWIAKAGALIVVVSNQERCEEHYGLRGKRLYTIQSNAAAIENMLLCAHALSLGACWIGVFDEEYLNSLLGIPGNFRAQAIITVGYPAEKPVEKELTDLASCVFFNSFGNRLEKAHLVLNDYSVEFESQAQKMKPMFKVGIDKLKANLKSLQQKAKK